ncbi:MAG TPA: ATP synthase F0 subunit B, partial [Candidatus Saccharimonadales bacterium]
MITAIAQFGDSASGIGALGVDGKAFIIQLVSFIIAFLVLKKWAFGPIVQMMERRRKTIESGVSLGEEMKKEQTALEARVETALRDARRQADG